MPVNLNALLRYMTIDSCLINKNVNCTISYLVEKCSEAISEAKGIPTSVSERTIRNDLRILKSDILGYNAPIIVENGVYKYSISNFSIYNKSLVDLELLIEIQELLIDEFKNISNKKLPFLLKAISQITKKSVPNKYLPDKSEKDSIGRYSKKRNNEYSKRLYNHILKLKNKKTVFFLGFKQKELVNWAYIFESI